MLVITRRAKEKIYIDGNIVITILDFDRGKFRIGIEAPREVTVRREPPVDRELISGSKQ